MLIYVRCKPQPKTAGPKPIAGISLQPRFPFG